ncbi:MAG TPA: type II toxin-antitoxin system RelE/ParE family toxin [Thermomicrobiales bacterium]|nr:type II toxin-antitoxin system RelE/ParE family toxin [Thermomicrobiales bacterium]
MWEIEATDEVADWYERLTTEQQIALEARLALLERYGPQLRRPTIGEIKGSEFDPQMKELICDEGGSLRVLFIFDPRRHAVLLVGGDKTGRWNKWYKTAIPEADRRYRDYLTELRQEGVIP